MTPRMVESSILGAMREKVSGLPSALALFDEPLARHCSMGIGGPADVLVIVDSLDALRRLLVLCAENQVRWILVGAGTNMLPSDDGFRGAVVKLSGDFNYVHVDGMDLVAGAGARLSALVESARAGGLSGLEFATGIPGCVGGSLPGNSGTASESLGDRVVDVELLSAGGDIGKLLPEDLGFTYRHSNLRKLGGVVTSARFRLAAGERSEIAAKVRMFAEQRKGQPLNLPNVGCIFKNPPGESAGRLIDEAGLKGAREGQIEISPTHANFMVNLGGGTAANVAELIDRVRESVKDRSGVELESEVLMLSETGQAT